MQTSSWVASGISWAHCRPTAEHELGTRLGAQSASVDVPTTRVVVTDDPRQSESGTRRAEVAYSLAGQR